jgi:hypothetical protein
MLIPACSLLTSLNGFSDGRAAEAGATAADDGGEGGGATADVTVDSANAPDVSDGALDAEDAGPNLFTVYANGTFENGCPGSGYNSTVTVDTTAHGGARSCRICSNAGGDAIFTFDEVVGTTPIVGARYRAEAWVRPAPSATPPAVGVFVELRTFQNPPFVVVEVNAEAKAIDATWQHRSIELDVTKAAPLLDVIIGSDTKAGTCFLVDDVEVHRVR